MKSGVDRIGRTVSVEFARRSCLEKVRYRSKNEARDRAAFLRTKYPDGKPLRPYRCTLCHGFHLTTTLPDGLRPIADGRVKGTTKRKGATP